MDDVSDKVEISGNELRGLYESNVAGEIRNIYWILITKPPDKHKMKWKYDIKIGKGKAIPVTGREGP
jgi:hypothetical protein